MLYSYTSPVWFKKAWSLLNVTEEMSLTVSDVSSCDTSSSSSSSSSEKET